MQVICRLVIANKALLFVTVKGTSNGEPAEGCPGAKTGWVGHGGPQTLITTVSPKATTASGVPTAHLTHFPIRRSVGSRSCGSGGRNCGCGSGSGLGCHCSSGCDCWICDGGFAGAEFFFFTLGFLRFFIGSTSLFCTFSGASTIPRHLDIRQQNQNEPGAHRHNHRSNRQHRLGRD